jgi:hypothetical protein
MAKTQVFNLVMELGDTNIPCDPCKLPCIDKHFIVVRPKDYDKRKKVLKHGALFVAFTIKGKTKKDDVDAIIEDAKRYQFKNG